MLFEATTYVLARNYTDAAISEAGGEVKEIQIETVSGTIPQDQLTELIKSSANVIVLDNKYYRLSRIEGSNYKYINSYTNGSGQVINMRELDVNKDTGDFYSKEIIIEGSSVEELEELLRHHIENNSIHVSVSDRNNWNNKVSIEARQIVDEKYDLKFKK